MISPPQAGIYCFQDIAAVIAVSEGLEVAPGRSRLVEIDINAGHLVAPIGKKLRIEQAYHIIIVHKNSNPPRNLSFSQLAGGAGGNPVEKASQLTKKFGTCKKAWYNNILPLRHHRDRRVT